jgi:hypothetical protein
MKSWRVVLPALFLLGASAAWAQKVDVDWNRNIDFSKFKTYAWTESKHPEKASGTSASSTASTRNSPRPA